MAARRQNPTRGSRAVRAAPQIPQYLLDQTIPRKVLQGRYMPHGKSTELRPFGYTVIEWFDPRTLRGEQTVDVVIEFVPRVNDADARAKQLPGPRVTVSRLEDQLAFHAAIGAPLPSNLPPPKKKPRFERAYAEAMGPSVAPADMARLIVAAHGREEGESKAIDLALSQKTAWWLEVVAAIKNGRKKNPLDPEAFAPHLEREAEGRHRADWTPHKMEEAMHAAEGRFVVELAGPLYGCGTNGCAAPLDDGRVLKVTIDEAEARWAWLTHRRGVPGMVQVDVPPTVIGLDDWYQGEGPEPGDDEPPIDPFKSPWKKGTRATRIWAYVREAADDISEALWRELGSAGYETGNSPRPDPEQQIYEGIEVFRRLGYELDDWAGRFNIGLDRDGNIVVRDGRLVRQERLPNPARKASALMSRLTPGEVASLMARMKLAWAECPWMNNGRRAMGQPLWKNLEAWLLEGDPEALAYVNTQLDPARCARDRKQRLAERRVDEAEARYEAQGVNLEDIAHLGPVRLAARARGKNVWLYHGTTTKLWPSIRRHGLRIGDAKVDPQETPGVYLTAMPGRGIYTGGTASFYAKRAAGVLGGRPVVLRVLVPFDDLTADTDDEDIQTGNYQFVTDYVGPQQILEVDRVRQPAPRQLTAAKAASRKGKKP